MLNMKPPISDEKVMEGNLFAKAALDNEKVKELFMALKSFYSNGFIADDSPLSEYATAYQNTGKYQPGLHLIAMERDLLILMAYRFLDETE